MNKINKQLETVFQEVSEHFANVPEITVTPGEGSPPDQYTVTYHITGVCKETDGDIHTCNEHVVSISLPFNFPHFPPNCHPESPIFHPDFDSSAICIGDAWEADKSIVKLIRHMGRMISGEIYSEVNAFNEEAAEWYKENNASLPFDTPKQEQNATIPVEKETEKSEPLSMDTLGDEAFGQALSLEEDSVAQKTIDVASLRLLAEQKRFHTLSRELKSREEQFDGRAELEEQAQSALNQATALLKEAHGLEHQGKHREALEQLNLIEKLISDSPTLQEEKERMGQAFELLGDWVSNEQDEVHSNIQTENDSDNGEQEPAEMDASPLPSEELTFFEEEVKEDRSKLFSVALGITILALVVTLISSYLFLGSSMKKAEKRYAECQKLLAADNFTGAEQECREALDLIGEVQLVKQNKKTDLSGKIHSLLDSPKLIQGLEGKTLVKGKYVSQAVKELLLGFMEAKKSGDASFTKKKWLEAERSYNKALEIAKKTEIEKNLLAEIRNRQPRARYNWIMAEGEKALSASDWKTARDSFSEALELAGANPHFQKEDLDQLQLLSNRAEFNSLRTHGHQLFKDGEWSTALENYTRALVIVKKLDLADSATISGLQENIARTKIYLAIEKGKQAFAASQWDTVIAEYEKAITLLEENSTLLSEINVEESGEKLARIMLHASIIRDKQGVAKHLKDEEYAPAIEQLENIKQTITESKFASHQQFQTILEEISSQISATERQILVLKLTTYLTDNYEKLFLKHYPAAARSVLSAPRAEYLKDIGNKMLFRMQCTETASNRPLRLQMDYLYSPTNGSWNFYSSDEN